MTHPGLYWQGRTGTDAGPENGPQIRFKAPCVCGRMSWWTQTYRGQHHIPIYDINCVCPEGQQ